MRERLFAPLAVLLCICVFSVPAAAWVTEVIDQGVGKYTSIALDSSAKFHVSYWDHVQDDLRYATNASGNWVTTTEDSVGDVGRHTSIALDALGKAHISYWDTTNDALKYATNASGAWVRTIVDSGGDVGQYTSIALDSSGKVHISYWDYLQDDLKYATNASGAWVTTTVDSAGYVGYYTSIALDSFGKVHISYHGDGLKHATNASGAWMTTTVDSVGDVGQDTSIALDSSGKVHISYLDHLLDDLKYATNASGTWVTTTVDSVGDVGRHTSIALDALGKAHISYWDNTNDALKYATNTSGVWVAESACERFPGCGQWTSIALSAAGAVYISHYGEDGTLLLTSGFAASADTSVTFFNGLNLFSYPGDVPEQLDSLNFGDTLGIADSIDQLLSFNNETQSYEAATYQNGDASGDVFYIEKGKGYLLYMKSDTEVTFSDVSLKAFSITMTPGMNLVGIPWEVPMTAYQFLEQLSQGRHSLTGYDLASGTFQSAFIDSGVTYGINLLLSAGHSVFVYYGPVDGSSLIISGISAEQISLSKPDQEGKLSVSGVVAPSITVRVCNNLAQCVETTAGPETGFFSVLIQGAEGAISVHLQGLSGTLFVPISLNLPGGCEDQDDDGFEAGLEDCEPFDCNDRDPSIHPGAKEGPWGDSTCADGFDNDCDGLIDGNDSGCLPCMTPQDCDDGNVCTDDSCSPSTGCVHTNNTASCDDRNACTTGDTCSGATCVGGPALNCDDGNVCTNDTCDAAQGACDNICNAHNSSDQCCTDTACSHGSGSTFPGGYYVLAFPATNAIVQDTALCMIKSQSILDTVNSLLPGFSHLIPEIVLPPETPDPFTLILSIPLLGTLQLTGHFVNDEIAIDPVDIPPLNLYEIFESFLGNGALTDLLGLNCLVSGKGTCTEDASCNDSNACTNDSCVSGVCQNTIVPGCGQNACLFDVQCDDYDNCTTDDCVLFTCQHAATPGCVFGPPVADGDTTGLSACSFDMAVNASELVVSRGPSGNHNCAGMNQGDLGNCRLTFTLNARLNRPY